MVSAEILEIFPFGDAESAETKGIAPNLERYFPFVENPR